MGQRHHYVSQFHLREFTDQRVTPPATPFLWVGSVTTGVVERRAPKNIGWSADLFSGPGGLRDRDASLESYLSSEVESPAAFALRAWVNEPPGSRPPIPAAVGRYLAWTAARSVSMRKLYQRWTDSLPVPDNEIQIAVPKNGMAASEPSERRHTMEHVDLGTRSDVPSDDVDRLRRAGWRLTVTQDDFLDFVHLQAWEFQSKQFPRLRWVVLDAPSGRNFIIGDRPLVWGFQDAIEDPPSALQHPSVQVFAALTRSVALFAFHAEASPPEQVPYTAINNAIASGSQEWIAGPTREAVADALQSRSA